jgi:hypothetical protein
MSTNIISALNNARDVITKLLSDNIDIREEGVYEAENWLIEYLSHYKMLKMSNYERIQTMSIDELAEFLLGDRNDIETYEEVAELSVTHCLDLNYKETTNKTFKDMMKIWLNKEIEETNVNNSLKKQGFIYNDDIGLKRYKI